MTTLQEARFALDRLIQARHAAGRPADIEQIDVSLTELCTPQHTDVFCYIYFAGASVDDLEFVSFEVACPPSLFDRDAARQALLRGPETVH